MRSRLISLLFPVASLLLMAVYLLMNLPKLETFLDDWADISSGRAAPRVQLMLAGEPIFQQRLKESEIFDAAGVRQIYFLHLPEDVFVQTRADIDTASLLIDEQRVKLTTTANPSALLAVSAGKRVYLLSAGELKYMLTVIWNERLRGKNITRCNPADLCDSVKITSDFWGPMQGPFLDTDIAPERRGLPRGRWVRGPKAALDIRSSKRQKVLLQIRLLAVQADQQVILRGAVKPLQRANDNLTALKAGGRSLYPSIYVFSLDLQPGANSLEMAFSNWSQPVGKGANPLAAYFTAIGIKAVD